MADVRWRVRLNQTGGSLTVTAAKAAVKDGVLFLMDDTNAPVFFAPAASVAYIRRVAPAAKKEAAAE